MDQKLQSFNFFTKTPLLEKGQPGGGSPLNTMDASSVIVLGSKLYAISKKNNCIFVLEITNDTPQGLKTIGSFTPYVDKLDFVEKLTVTNAQGKQHYLVTFGMDTDQGQGQGQGLKATYVKFWEHDENITSTDLEALSKVILLY